MRNSSLGLHDNDGKLEAGTDTQSQQDLAANYKGSRFARINGVKKTSSDR